MDPHLPVVAHSVNPYLPRSGSWIYSQICTLRRYRAIVITKRLENPEYFPFTPVFARSQLWLPNQLYQRFGRRWLYGYFPFHRTAVVRQRARLLHSHFGDRACADVSLKQAVGIPQVSSFYGADVWKLSRDAEWLDRYRVLFEAGECFLVEGNAMRDKVIAMGCAPEKVRVHHLGVDLAQIPFAPRQPEGDGEVRFLIAGRAIEKKGHDLAIQAFERVRRRYAKARLGIMIIARGRHEERTLAQLREKIRASGVEESVTLYGFQPYAQYLEALRRYHIFLAPSVHAADGDAEGGAPVTIIEMCASGMPVIGSAHCDIPEVLGHGASGVLVPEGDVEALAEAMARLLAEPKSWLAYARAGRAHIDAQYNVRHQGPALEDTYDELLGVAA